MRFILNIVLLCIPFMLMAPALHAEGETSPLAVVAQPEAAEFKSFETWLEEFRAEAMEAGISKSVLSDAFSDVDEPLEAVLEKDTKQPEFKQVFEEYKKNILTNGRIKAAKEQWRDNEQLLIKVENDYGVPAQTMLALWSIESNFGKIQGRHPIIGALATLAFDGRRSLFFRSQLMDALRILQQEKMSSSELIGSWAGAMGQVQFMPSSFLKYAVDYNGDGKKDIWNSKADAVASMANYLNDKGWDAKHGWGVPVRLPESKKHDWSSLKERLPYSTWKKYGVRQKNGAMLAGIRLEARLILIDGDKGKAYLVSPNFDILMDWNRSTYFAASVGMLADALGDEP